MQDANSASSSRLVITRSSFLLFAKPLELLQQIADIVRAAGGKQPGEHHAHPGRGEGEPQRREQIRPRRKAEGDPCRRRGQLGEPRFEIPFGEHLHHALDVLHDGLHNDRQRQNQHNSFHSVCTPFLIPARAGAQDPLPGG